MSSPQHTLNIYQKPAQGNAFITRLPVYNYKHSINAIGGFDTASFDIALRSVAEMKQFLDQYVGNRGAIYVDNPAEPAWEGFINRMDFSAGGTKYSISLDKMANRVRAVYTPTAGGLVQTAVTSDTASQAFYGIKQEQIELGVMFTATGTTLMRDVVLAQRAWPKTSMMADSGSGGLLHVQCLGFYHTLGWGDYRDTATGAIQLGVFVDTILGTVVNGTTFFDNTDLTETAANTNTIERTTARAETTWDALVKARESGDATNYWVMGITPTLFSTGTRRFYYRQASSDIVYTARQSDGLRIRNLYGQLVRPWTVRPDAGVRVSDQLIGWNGVGDNPAESYILKVEYDANQQSVILSGDDDETTEGVFNLKRFNKAQGARFGAPRRLA